MKDSIIITVIGGGSVNWMPGLMKDVYMIDEVNGGEIRLVDPNDEHVQAVAEMLRAFNKMKNKEYKISVIKERTEALKSADFVITTFSPGSMDAFWNDIEIPIKYGIRQPVSMTVGPCGISASLRTIPIAYELVEEMEKYCCGAWLLNVTNPMSTVTHAMNLAAKKTKVIGLCHEFHSFPEYIGHILGLYKPEGMGITEYLYKWLEEKGLKYTVAGINHFIWLTEASLNGKDVIPKIKAFCRNNLEIRNDKECSTYHNNHAAKLAMCRQLGYLPLAGDRHLIEFYPSLCNVRNGYGMKYGVNKTTVDSRRLDKVRKLDNIRKIALGETEVKWQMSGEEITEIIRAIVTGTSTVGIVNLPNKGQISNLQENVIVETLAAIEAGVVKPKDSGNLPGAVRSLCSLHSDIHGMTVKAALEGNMELFIEALSLDPLSAGADFSELPDMADELIKANRKWLPRFYG